MSRYELKPYRTPSDRLTCPSCGHRREFSPYIDTEKYCILLSVAATGRKVAGIITSPPSISKTTRSVKDCTELCVPHRACSSVARNLRRIIFLCLLSKERTHGEKITIYIGFSCPVSGRLSPTVFLTSTGSERRSTSETPEDFPPLSPK